MTNSLTTTATALAPPEILAVSSAGAWTNAQSAREGGYPATHAFDGEKILCGRNLDFQITGDRESVNCAQCLAQLSPVAEWHAHLDLQVRAGQMAKDTATTYRQGMRKLTEWASQQETWNRTLILEWVAALKAEGKAVKTVSIWLTGARCFFQWMLSEGRITVDPTAGVKAGKSFQAGGRKRREELTQSEIIKLKAFVARSL